MWAEHMSAASKAPFYPSTRLVNHPGRQEVLTCRRGGRLEKNSGVAQVQADQGQNWDSNLVLGASKPLLPPLGLTVAPT